MIASAASSSRLRSKMSASAPDSSANSMIGRVFDACTSATSVALSVSCVIIHAAPTACTSPPKFDTSVAAQRLRKAACRNGASAEDDAGGAGSRKGGGAGLDIIGARPAL